MKYDENAISKNLVAEITTWGNNCALSCTSIFLIEAFLSNQLSKKAEENLAALINDYYETSLSVEQLRDVFLNIITLPSDRQLVLGQPLRAFIYAMGVESEEGDMLSNEAFRPIAEEFGFNVVFYADVDKKINPSGIIPEIIIDQKSTLTLCPYYHASHYDLIMDDEESADMHNQSSFIESDLNLPVEIDAKEKLRERIKEIISHHYDPKNQYQWIDEETQDLYKLADILQDDQPSDAASIRLVADNLQSLNEENSKNEERVKEELEDIIKEAKPVLNKHGIFERVCKIADIILAKVTFNRVTTGISSIYLGIKRKLETVNKLDTEEGVDLVGGKAQPVGLAL
ncbi:MAG: hypothetical protein KKE11_01385 [Gammaproteobacteria bacterium]|nr:hypothetical protein [Gammaproteobacteria bacterium]